MKNLNKFLTAAAVLCSASNAQMQAEVKLPTLISDGMVVQCDAPVRLWGQADPGEQVAIDIAKTNKKGKKFSAKATVVADEQGQWTAELPALPVGNTYKISINDQVVDNVLPGYVLLCSGQSNMELPVRRVTDMFADEIAAYENPQIRHFRVPNEVEFHQPLDELRGGSWKALTQDNVMDFSALAYFISKELNAQTGLPVGIINASWGGTPIEAWISEEWLADFPRSLAEKRIYEDDDYRARIKRLEGENYHRWDQTLYATDPGMQAPVKWFMPECDDSDWDVVDLLDVDWSGDGYNPLNGTHWFRKNVELEGIDGQDATLRLGCIVDADSVYVNGTFVGNITYQYPPRIYHVPAGVLHDGTNNITIRLISQNGFPHFVPEKPYKLIVGDDEYKLDTDWKHHIGAIMPHGPAMEFFHYKPTVLYNALIHPIRHYPVMGAVWYQGESNVGRPNEYELMLPCLMGNWREAMDDADLPFYIVELADFLPMNDRRGRGQWAELREAQANGVAATEGATLIKNRDLGEWNDIHPLDKKTLAGRVVEAIIANQQ